MSHVPCPSTSSTIRRRRRRRRFRLDPVTLPRTRFEYAQHQTGKASTSSTRKQHHFNPHDGTPTMSVRRARALPLHTLPRAAPPARPRLPPSSWIAHAPPTRTLHQSPIRLDTKQDDHASLPPAKDLSELTPEQVKSASAELQSTDLLDVYNSLVARGLIVWDAEQVRCVMEVSDHGPPFLPRRTPS
jgi:hypothetical protein